MSMPKRQATCHPDRWHYGKGYCRLCYQKHKKVNSVRAKCHPDRPHHGRGLCRRCWYKKYNKSVNAAYYKKNKGTIQSNHADYYKKNEAALVARHAAYYRLNREAISKQRVEQRVANPVAALLKWAKRRAQRKGLEFTITEADIVIPKVCPVLGIPLIVSKGKRSAASPTLDRIDSKLGYIPSNVAVISWKANVIKNYGTVEEHRRIADWMEKRLSP